MTLIASWVGVDSKKGGNQVSSVYFASDSRFSWNSQSVYDEGMKVFCSLKYPYIFGYCGDVLFPSHAIERIIYKIDCDLLFGEDVDSFTKKIHIICDEIETSLKQYPMSINFSILFGSRESTYDFHVGQIDYHDNNLTFKELVLPKIFVWSKIREDSTENQGGNYAKQNIFFRNQEQIFKIFRTK